MKAINIFFAVASAAGAVVAETSLSEMVAADVAQPVRLADGKAQPWWNDNAIWFMYPPSFDFPECGVASYRYIVRDANGKMFTYTDKTPHAIVRNWVSLPTGVTTVWCEAMDSHNCCFKRSSRSFWKMAPYKPGTYPKAPRSYAEALDLGYDYYLNLKTMRDLVATGKPDMDYNLNCYPAKMHSATINVMVRLAKHDPNRRAQAIGVATAAAKYLLSISLGADTPLAGFPPTYIGTKLAASRNAGINMLSYPAMVGKAYVALSEVTKDENYMDAAKQIAATYLKLQGADGTWCMKIRESDGAEVTPNRLLPATVVDFFDALYEATHDERYRNASDRAFAFFERGPMNDWNWEGQFEDVDPSRKYQNLTKHQACWSAMRILRRWPGDAKRLAQARELLRFAEDQFVCWERPYKAEKIPIWGRYFVEWTVEPAVVEQYHYREPVDASAYRLVMTYLALYKASGNKLDLAKARTLGDSIVRVQQANGRIPTIWTTSGLDLQSDWINCFAASLEALDALSNLRQ